MSPKVLEPADAGRPTSMCAAVQIGSQFHRLPLFQEIFRYIQSLAMLAAARLKAKKCHTALAGGHPQARCSHEPVRARHSETNLCGHQSQLQFKTPVGSVECIGEFEFSTVKHGSNLKQNSNPCMLLPQRLLALGATSGRREDTTRSTSRSTGTKVRTGDDLQQDRGNERQLVCYLSQSLGVCPSILCI
jgi:hypothetical protein